MGIFGFFFLVFSWAERSSSLFRRVVLTMGEMFLVCYRFRGGGVRVMVLRSSFCVVVFCERLRKSRCWRVGGFGGSRR